MTRRDHRLIANVLLHAKERGEDVTRLVEYFALVLRQDNPRFDRERFFKSCGYERKECRESLLPAGAAALKPFAGAKETTP